MADLPDSWADEAWPLDELDVGSVFRPRNWSDSHADAPQVADLAAQAQALVDRFGMSMEQALVSCQRREQIRAHFAGRPASSQIAAAGAAGVAAGSSLRSAIISAREQEQLEQARKAAGDFEAAWRKLSEVFADAADGLVASLRSMCETLEAGFGEAEAKSRLQPMCPTHGVLASGGFCRRCSAAQARRSKR